MKVSPLAAIDFIGFFALIHNRQKIDRDSAGGESSVQGQTGTHPFRGVPLSLYSTRAKLTLKILLMFFVLVGTVVKQR